MTPEDRLHAREALERGRLTIDQVELIRAETEKTGRPFLEIAAARGFPKPPAPPRPRTPLVFMGMLAASFVIFAGLLVATLFYMRDRSRREEDLALESERMREETERKAGQARLAYERRIVEARESRGRAALEKARAAMALVEQRLKSDPSAALDLPLSEAASGYNTYLEIHPEDAPVHVERSRTRELRRNFDKAVEDLERAIELDPKLQPPLQDRLRQLRLKSPRK